MTQRRVLWGYGDGFVPCLFWVRHRVFPTHFAVMRQVSAVLTGSVLGAAGGLCKVHVMAPSAQVRPAETNSGTQPHCTTFDSNYRHFVTLSLPGPILRAVSNDKSSVQSHEAELPSGLCTRCTFRPQHTCTATNTCGRPGCLLRQRTCVCKATDAPCRHVKLRLGWHFAGCFYRSPLWYSEMPRSESDYAALPVTINLRSLDATGLTSGQRHEDASSVGSLFRSTHSAIPPRPPCHQLTGANSMSRCLILTAPPRNAGIRKENFNSS